MPIFRRRSAPIDADGFSGTGIAPAEIADGDLKTLRINGRSIMVTRVGDALYALSQSCPHAAGDMSAGTLHRGRISCPEHGYKFDVRTGRILWPSDELYRLKQYAIKVVDDEIYIRAG